MTESDFNATATDGTTELAFAGSSKWDLIGRASVPKFVLSRGGSDEGEIFLGPVRLRFLGFSSPVSIAAVYSGAMAAHVVLVDATGGAYGFGRNDDGQLGRPALRSRRHPIRFELLQARTGVKEKADTRVIHAACGRGHTLLVTSTGRAFSCGNNSCGQLGNGSTSDVRKPEVSELQSVILPDIERAICVAAGANFSVFACASGAVYCSGSGQYGQLGNGRTGECIETGNRVSYDLVSTPERIRGFGDGEGEVKVTMVAAGNHHALALDENGKVWSWGWGGFGRLGHKTPKNELRPRQIQTFDHLKHKLDIIACGQTSSYAACSASKTLYMWGITKKNGESNMYPKPIFDLQGWTINSIAASLSSTIVSAEESTISWGPSPTFGELGYGEGKSKSSTKPKVIDAVEGLKVEQVAMGINFSAMLLSIRSDADKKLLNALPVHEVHIDEFIKKVTNASKNLKADEGSKTPTKRGQKRKRK